jgi:hypothetical protein
LQRSGGLWFEAIRANSSRNPISKIPNTAQEIEILPSKCEGPEFNPSTTKKKKKEKE